MSKLIHAYVSAAMLALAGCGPVEYRTYYEGIADPGFDLRQIQTVGLIPLHWTSTAKEKSVDELTEKKLLYHCEAELRKREFVVQYVPLECLKETTDREIHCHGMSVYPDLTLLMEYEVQQGVVTVPGRSSGSFHVGPYGGGGWLSGHSSYNVATYTLGIQVTLWAGPPEYMQQVWRGVIVQGSPQPDLVDRSEYMIHSLFARKFPRIKRK